MLRAPFRLTTLGRLALSDAMGAEDPTLATRRRKLAVLVVLAVSRKPITRDALSDLFWGDQPEERARHSLSDTLSHLRRTLGAESIATRRAEISITSGTPLAVDIVELHGAAQAKQWGTVTRLYGGPFLEGIHVPDSPRFDQWVTTQRATVERLYETACRHECARLADAEAWSECATLAARWLDRAPLSIEAAKRLLVALELGASSAERGRLDALNAYDTLAQRLRTEFDTAPAPEIVARAEGWRVRRQAATEPTALVETAATVASVASRAAVASAGPVGGASNERGGSPFLPRRGRWLAGAGVLIAAAAIALALRPHEGIADERGAGRFITTRSAEARAAYVASFATPDLRGEAPDVIERLERAVELDPTFALAWQRLAWQLEGDESQRARVHDALARARSLSDSVSEYERGIILGSYHMIVSGNLSEAAAALRAALAIEPRSVGIWHRLGMVYQYLGDDRRAADAYSAANRITPTSAARWINLIDVRFAAGDTAGAARAIDSMALHLPGHSSVYVMGANLASATGDLDRAMLQVRAFTTSTPGDPRIQAFGRMYRSRIHWTAGRVDAGDSDAREAMERNMVRGDSVWALRDGLALAQATLWLRHDRAKAGRLLGEILERVPLDSLRPLDRPWLEIALTAAVVGDVARSRAALDAYGREIPTHLQAREESLRHHAEGALALVEGRIDDAVRHLEQAAFPECRVCGLPELGLAHEALGDPRAAERVYREYVETPTLRRTDLLDALHLRWVRARIAGRERSWSPALP